MLSMIWPVALVVLANVFYNIVTKSTPGDANAFLSLSVTYVSAAVVSFLVYVFTGHRSIGEEFSKINWTAFALGIVIVGLEVGYIFLYRAGWKLNTGSLVANITLAVALIFVGLVLYKEKISLKQTAGIVLCLAGLVLVTK